MPPFQSVGQYSSNVMNTQSTQNPPHYMHCIFKENMTTQNTGVGTGKNQCPSMDYHRVAGGKANICTDPGDFVASLESILTVLYVPDEYQTHFTSVRASKFDHIYLGGFDKG